MAEKITGVEGQTTEDQVLASLVDAGRIDAAAAMLAEGAGHAGFLDLWRKSTLESRMGLVLGAESALETEPHSLDSIVPNLLQVLGTDDAARRGDTADLLGMIGHPSARNGLEALLEDPNDDVAEIAAESLEALRQEADPQ
jgi:HEAT repeat protein